LRGDPASDTIPQLAVDFERGFLVEPGFVEVGRFGLVLSQPPRRTRMPSGMASQARRAIKG
jgi:hypothetical protein